MTGFRKKLSQGPKRAKSAYLYFCEENRKKITKELGPSVQSKDVTKALGQLWNETKKNGDLSKYEKLSKKDKLRYENEKKNHEVSTGVEDEVAVDEVDEVEEVEEEVEEEVVSSPPRKKKAPRKKGSKKK